MSLIGVCHRYTYIFHGYSGISVVFRYFSDSCDPTLTILAIFCSPVPRRFHMNLSNIGLAAPEEKSFEILNIIPIQMYRAHTNA